LLLSLSLLSITSFVIETPVIIVAAHVVSIGVSTYVVIVAFVRGYSFICQSSTKLNIGGS
jgi:hypothetical protein